MKKINKIIQKAIHSKYIGYMLIILLSAIIMAPIFTMDLTQNNEAKIHMSRILAIDSVLKDGIFPPLIDYSFMERIWVCSKYFLWTYYNVYTNNFIKYFWNIRTRIKGICTNNSGSIRNNDV